MVIRPQLADDSFYGKQILSETNGNYFDLSPPMTAEITTGVVNFDIFSIYFFPAENGRYDRGKIKGKVKVIGERINSADTTISFSVAPPVFASAPASHLSHLGQFDLMPVAKK